MFVKISLEYDGPSHSGASPLVGKEADSAEGLFAHGEISKPQQDVATISKVIHLPFFFHQDRGETNSALLGYGKINSEQLTPEPTVGASLVAYS